MGYDKRLSKNDRKAITKARRITKATGFRESEKHLSALQQGHVSMTQTVKLEQFEGAFTN